MKNEDKKKFEADTHTRTKKELIKYFSSTYNKIEIS